MSLLLGFAVGAIVAWHVPQPFWVKLILTYLKAKFKKEVVAKINKDEIEAKITAFKADLKKGEAKLKKEFVEFLEKVKNELNNP